MYSFTGNCAASVPISTFMCLRAIYIFPGTVHVFPAAERADRSSEYINRSTDTWMWKLGLWPRNSFSGNFCFEFLVLILCCVSAGPQLAAFILNRLLLPVRLLAGYLPSALLSHWISNVHWHPLPTICLGEAEVLTIFWSVADPGCLSRILIFTHPGSRISDPGSKNSNKRQVWKKSVVIPFYVATNFTKLKIILVLKRWIWADFQRIIEPFTQKIVTKLSKILVWDPGSRKNLFRIPYPGSRGQRGTGSRIPDLDPQHWFKKNQAPCQIWDVFVVRKLLVCRRSPPPPPTHHQTGGLPLATRCQKRTQQSRQRAAGSWQEWIKVYCNPRGGR